MVNFCEKDLMDILACPICKGDLILNVVEENEEEGHIRNPLLLCL